MWCRRRRNGRQRRPNRSNGRLHPASENVAISHWPKIPNFAFRRHQAFRPRRCPIWIGWARTLIDLAGIARRRPAACRSRKRHGRNHRSPGDDSARAPCRCRREHFRDPGEVARAMLGDRLRPSPSGEDRMDHQPNTPPTSPGALGQITAARRQTRRRDRHAAHQAGKPAHAGRGVSNIWSRSRKRSACRLTSVTTFDDAQQDHEREKQQVDIGLHLAGVAQRADLGDDLLARAAEVPVPPPPPTRRRASISSRSMRWKK